MTGESTGGVMGKRIATGLGILVLGWALKFGWNVVTVEPIELSEDSRAEWIAEDDDWIAEEVAAGTAAPASGWLRQPKHGSFEGDPARMQELIEQFEAAGAARIWMVGIEELGRTQLSDTIAVELPAGGYTRDRLFEIEAELRDGDGTPDVGQGYLVISFD